MMVPDDVGMFAFHGDAALKATVLERLERYEAQGSTELKRAMLQEKWSRRAQDGPVLNPYPKIARREDTVGIRISGEVSTSYVLGAVQQNRLCLLGDADRRIYLVQHPIERTFQELLGVPPTLVNLLRVVSMGLPPERETPWLRQFWAAVPVGASLWRAPMRLILWALSDSTDGILGLSGADAEGGEGGRGVQAVRDFLALYQRWLAGGGAERQPWFSLVEPAEDDVKNSRRRGDDGQYVYDLPASVRCGLLAAACAARAARVEECVVTPLPEGTAATQIVGDNLDAPGKAIVQAGLYASDKGIDPDGWYEACAGVLLDILADCPVPDRAGG